MRQRVSPFVSSFDYGVEILLTHGGEHVLGDGMDHTAADGRARGGLSCIAAVLVA